MTSYENYGSTFSFVVVCAADMVLPANFHPSERYGTGQDFYGVCLVWCLRHFEKAMCCGMDATRRASEQLV